MKNSNMKSREGRLNIFRGDTNRAGGKKFNPSVFFL